MTTLTNRFLTKALRTLCCAGALTACSAWATVVTWQSSPIGASGSVGATKDLFQPGYTNTARGFDNTAGTDASHQLLFKSAPENGGASLTDALNEKSQAGDTDIHLESRSTLSQSGAQISAGSKQPDESLLVADSNTQARPATELDDAMASAFDEEFVSVPTVQFASLAGGSKDVSVISIAAVNVDPVPVPEMSALFPIVGLIAAVSCTQILRRRRAAQLIASRSLA